MLEEKIVESVKKAVMEENKENQKNYEFEKKKLFKYLGDSLVSDLKRYKAFVAGGLITSLFCNRDINDVDIYFRDKEDAADFVHETIENNTWIISHTQKATLFKVNNIQCQVIHFDYFNNTDDIFNRFDFTVCMGAYDFDKDQFVFHPDFLKHNAQRILKFNEHTAYPIISAMRVQKYEEKGYKISKSEWVKILLTCSNLKINTYEQLKSQIGGMYGINYDEIIKPLENEPFDLMKAISKFNELSLTDQYFEAPIGSSNIPSEVSDIVYEINGRKRRVFKFKDTWYEHIARDFEFISYDSEHPEKYEIENVEDVFKIPYKFYKFVKKTDNGYFSFYDGHFEYKLGEVATAKEDGYGYGLYGGRMDEIDSFPHSDSEGSVLIELEVNSIDDIIDINTFKAKKAKSIREVPNSEYKRKEK